MIGIFLGGQGELLINYKDDFVAYLRDKGEKKYREMSREEVIEALEEFQKDPEYNPFIQEN